MSPPLAVTRPDGSRRYVHPETGESVPSVTTVLKVIAKPKITEWAARKAAQFAVLHMDEMHGLSAAEKVDRIAGEHEQISGAARELGTAIHETIDAWQKGEAAEDPEGSGPYLNRFIDWVLDVQPSFIYNECTLWSRKHEYAGTADAIAEINHKVYLLDFKGLALDTPLPTPEGWTTMGAVQVGDRLFDRNGKTCRVTEKSSVHLKRCYRVFFDDGSEIVCDHDHRWLTVTGQSSCMRQGVWTTEEIAGRLFGSNKQRDQRVPVAGALNLPERDLPVHPYVLGCWLGDGKTASGEFFGADDFIFSEISRCGYAIGSNSEKREGFCQARTIYGLRTQLRENDLLGHKHIPSAYLRASTAQRLALLQGLMDTDGCWNRARNSAVFSVTNKTLAHDLHELALSLGQRANFHEFTARGFGKESAAWRVTFTPNGINPFRLPRKADQVTDGTARSSRRIITSAQPTVSVRTQCVMVDSPDHTYLCGETMIPTHNTGKGIYAEVGLQLSALAGCDFVITPDGQEHEIPPVECLAALHIRPRSCRLFPVNNQEENFTCFLAAREILRWQEDISPHVLGEPR